MRPALLCLFTFFCMLLQAQDKLYLVDGKVKRCQVHRLGQEYVHYTDSTVADSIPLSSIILIEYANGMADILNPPNYDLEYDPKAPPSASATFNKKYNSNYVSFNTLGLCNADISGFYEHMPRGKRYSFGMMASYNFNLQSTLQNVFIRMLHNGKKNYDVGLLFNLYLTDISEELQIYFGVMMKYTDFNFTKADTDTSGGKNMVSYTPAQGSQLATMFTAGTNTFLNDKIFIRSIAAVGAFRLKGDYKEQFNKEINIDKNPNERIQYNYLPKLYLGVMIGFNF